MSAKAIDETGKRYGLLRVMGVAGYTPQRRLIWGCLCDCGETTTAVGTELRKGSKMSCGCLRSLLASTRGKRRIGRLGLHLMGGTHDDE